MGRLGAGFLIQHMSSFHASALRQIRTIICASLGLAATTHAVDAQSPNRLDEPPKLLLNAPPRESMGKPLTRDQVRSCMKSAVTVSENDKKLIEVAKKIEQEKQDFEARELALKVAQRSLDRSNRAAIDAFNKKIDELDEAKKALNASIDAYNAGRRDGHALMYAHNSDCAGKPFSKADEDAVRIELGLSESALKTLPR